MTLEHTHLRCKAVSTIHDIVNALRAIAAGRIQGAQRSLTAARAYQAEVERALAFLPETNWSVPTGRAVLLVVAMSEQPLCGAFNHDLLELVERRRRELLQIGEVRFLAIGQRGRRLLASRGIMADDTEPGATALPGLRDLVRHVAARVSPAYAAGTCGAVHVIYSRYQSVSEQIPTEEQLLPPRPRPGGGTSTVAARKFVHYLSLPELTAGLVGEYTFINLYRMVAESYASEQAARLLAMDAATRNTERLLQTLQDLERRERQSEITRQVLELISAHFSIEELDPESAAQPDGPTTSSERMPASG